MSFDPYFSDVSLLLHCDGSNGSTTFKDHSGTAKTCAAIGNAQITTAQSVFGGASAAFDGAGDGIGVTYAADLNLAGGAWCLEGRARYVATSGACILVDFRGTSSQTSSWVCFITPGDRKLAIYDGVADTVPIETPTNAIPTTSTWFAWAITQSSGTTRIFIDGVKVAENSAFTTRATHSTGLRIGLQYDSTNPWNGQLDELRITKGQARYTADYTLATQEFSGVIDGRIEASSPLGAPAILAVLDVSGYLSNSSPLGSPAVFGALVFGRAAVSSPLGSPALFGRLVYGLVSASSPLNAAAILGFHDFTAQVDINSRTTYVMDLVTPGGLVRVPISSWQSTIHADEASYLQCVIPAVSPWVSALETATSFVVSRRATLTTGTAYEYPMASAPTQTISLDQSGRRHTATVSGYFAPFATLPAPVSSLNRTLEKVRLSSSTGGRRRVQCAIDWLLQPGQNAVLDGEPFEVSYINYFCNTDSESMVVGEAEA